VVDDLGYPAEVRARERVARVREQRVGAARERDVAFAGGLGRMRPQVRRVAVEPPEVALVDGLEVVIERAVVAAAVPLALQARRQLQPLGNLGGDVALV
jgi:hypothetical protein